MPNPKVIINSLFLLNYIEVYFPLGCKTGVHFPSYCALTFEQNRTAARINAHCDETDKTRAFGTLGNHWEVVREL